MAVPLSAPLAIRDHVKQWSVVMGFVAASCLSGCSKSESGVAVYPADTTVLFHSKPARGALIALHPTVDRTADVPNPHGTVQEDGSVKFTTYQAEDGAPAGDYTATIEWFPAVKRAGDTVPGPNVLPKKYAKPNTSDVHVTIAAGDNHLARIELK